MPTTLPPSSSTTGSPTPPPGPQALRLIAGLIPYDSSVTGPEIHRTLVERQNLIVRRAVAVFDRDTSEGATWTAVLGTKPADARTAQRWRRPGQVVAACLDRY
ncbi:hypothetical protein AB0X98_02620 [Rothia koreensis]|uniref:hypothetical protein n=1 Tax=Rothia koreensis TaxID=592378 RepID=UPI003F274DDA